MAFTNLYRIKVLSVKWSMIFFRNIINNINDPTLPRSSKSPSPWPSWPPWPPWPASPWDPLGRAMVLHSIRTACSAAACCTCSRCSSEASRKAWGHFKNHWERKNELKSQLRTSPHLLKRTHLLKRIAHVLKRISHVIMLYHVFFKAGSCLQPILFGVNLLGERMAHITQTLGRSSSPTIRNYLNWWYWKITKTDQNRTNSVWNLMDGLNAHPMFASPHILVMMYYIFNMCVWYIYIYNIIYIIYCIYLYLALIYGDPGIARRLSVGCRTKQLLRSTSATQPWTFGWPEHPGSAHNSSSIAYKVGKTCRYI